MSARRPAAAALALALAGCGTSDPSPVWPAPGTGPAAPVSAPAVAGPAASGDPSVDPVEAAENARRSQKMLEVVARMRALPVKKPVPGRTLSRGKMLERIRAHVDKDVPRAVLFDQGESLAALGLVPADYDFVEGIFALLEGQIAGFYEPDDGTMYLADDLGEEEAAATLSHELVHALQDQSFSLKDMLDFAPGEGDRTTAAHALAEGDAMVAMFDVMAGGPTDIPVEAVRLSATASMAMTASTAATPRALQASLIAPYVDGFRLVQGLRKRGGWPAVDAVWRKLPETTEQLLHLDKLDAREPAVKVPTPPVSALGATGRSPSTSPWASRGCASPSPTGHRTPWPSRPPQVGAAIAAWWRAASRRRDATAGLSHRAEAGRAVALAWSLVMDSDADAAEVAAILAKQWGGAGARAASGCKEREDLGPAAWARKGKALAFVAGPFQRSGKAAKSLSDCKAASTWAGAVLASAAASPAPVTAAAR
ncbi:MAG: DUF6782 family putative metallopeptidase [Polyangiaceae bacterium]